MSTLDKMHRFRQKVGVPLGCPDAYPEVSEIWYVAGNHTALAWDVSIYIYRERERDIEEYV